MPRAPLVSASFFFFKQLVVMITVVDIQTNNAYSYGEDHGFGRRLFIIYDGIHYDGERTLNAGAGGRGEVSRELAFFVFWDVEMGR